MVSHSVTCHPTQVSTPRLNPSHTGRYSIYLPLAHCEQVRQCLYGEADAPKRRQIPPDSCSAEIHLRCQCSYRNNADVPLPTLGMIEVNVQPFVIFPGNLS